MEKESVSKVLPDPHKVYDFVGDLKNKYGVEFCKVTIELKAAQEENSTLKNELEQAIKKIDLSERQKFKKAKREIENLKKELQIVKSKREDLKGRLKITLSELDVKQAALNKMNTDSKILKDILCNKKFPFNKSSLNYDHGASTSKSKEVAKSTKD
ncbi:hypothetical protein CKAN_00184800 [Cinnamomum micranthum f. kanehirae]|uniref:Uncharacterized protein n=1 Tax=Cinnamomum micranthum f. kanehirae TaxID=337451 RepID=A0A3S3MBW0_9MAGN|nr:hypothetical protein CKAN_00184800 [Cinnamomum micranthum f. kanehirae]